MASFICSIDTLADYENLFGESSFSSIGFQMLLDYHEDMNLRLDEVGRLEHYFSEYESLLEAAREYIDDEIIAQYEEDGDDQILLNAFEDKYIDIMYDSASGVCVVDER